MRQILQRGGCSVKKWKKILVLLFCLSLVRIFGPGSPATVQAAGKTGLFRDGGKYYYYSNDKKQTGKWKNIKLNTAGKKVKYRFYFGSDGAAYAGSIDGDGILTLAAKKIGGKVYGFDHLGHMLKGVYVSKRQFYVFDSSTGVYDKKNSKKLRNASKEGAGDKKLINLLAKLGCKPQKITENIATNYGNGTGSIYSYTGFELHIFQDAETGARSVMTVMGTPLPNYDMEQGTDLAEAELAGARLKKTGGKYYGYDGSGALIKSRWATINGYRYYFKADGSAQTGSASISGKRYLFNTKGRLLKGTKDRFVTISKKRYYVYKDGTVATGWLVVDRALYYADAKGVLKRKKTYGGISFDSTGKAKSSAASNLKITVMQIVDSITDSTMTKEQKLKACWDYVVSDQRFVFYQRTPDFTKKGWQVQEALTMLNSRAGSSYGFSCAFAALASEIGYNPFVVAGKVSSKNAAEGLTAHSWVIIDQKYYDPGAQFRGWWTGIYGLADYEIQNLINYKVNFQKDV